MDKPTLRGGLPRHVCWIMNAARTLAPSASRTPARMAFRRCISGRSAGPVRPAAMRPFAAVYSATKGMTMPPNRSPLLASIKSALNVKGPAPLIR